MWTYEPRRPRLRRGRALPTLGHLLGSNAGYPDYRNPRVVRKSATCTAASPSSTRTVPAWRAGAGTARVTTVPLAARPTTSGEMSRSARDQVVTGFFLAAMIARNAG